VRSALAVERLFVFRSVKNMGSSHATSEVCHGWQTTGFLRDAGPQKRRKFCPQHCAVLSLLRASPGWPYMASRRTHAFDPWTDLQRSGQQVTIHARGPHVSAASAMPTRPRPPALEPSADSRATAMAKPKHSASIPTDQISRSIIIVRDHNVLLDSELAALYGVATKVLVQAVKRNMARFPDDFMLQLTSEEWERLRSQSVTLKAGRGQHRKYLPYAFTEQGVAMLASVLKSPRAIAVNIQIMRAFVQLRALLNSNKQLARQFARLEARLSKRLDDHDDAIAVILVAIRELMNPPASKRRGIGFTAKL
jgi:ORF6N domain